jgi:tetratricopeptide (TPR) repeat protein
LGVIFHEQQKYSEAIEYYDKAIQIEPNSWIYHRDKGITYFCVFDYDNALKCYTEAIQIDPSNSGVRERIDIVLMLKKKLTQPIALKRKKKY